MLVWHVRCRWCNVPASNSCSAGLQMPPGKRIAALPQRLHNCAPPHTRQSGSPNVGAPRMLAVLHGPAGEVTQVSIRARTLLVGDQAQASLNGRCCHAEYGCIQLLRTARVIVGAAASTAETPCGMTSTAHVPLRRSSMPSSSSSSESSHTGTLQWRLPAGSVLPLPARGCASSGCRNVAARLTQVTAQPKLYASDPHSSMQDC